MLQRIGLAQALLNDPALLPLFLDEPTSGLYSFGRRLVRDIIQSQREAWRYRAFELSFAE